jgi:hypothetical protein
MQIHSTMLRALNRMAVASIGGLVGCTAVGPDGIPDNGDEIELPPGYNMRLDADNNLEGSVSIEGWWLVRGEFNLYADRRDVGELYSQQCISGRLMDDELNRESRQFDRRRVRVYGWLRPFGSDQISIAPSYIENYCASQYVLYAVRYELLD